MLHEFLTSNRNELIRRCREKVAKRSAPAEITAAVDHGVPLFLQQLADTLLAEEKNPRVGAVDPERTPAPTDIGRTAALHGAHLLRMGYTVDQVVHDYRDVCQAVTEMAVEQKKPIATSEFRVLNRCLDNAIADAVTAYGENHRVSLNDQAEALHDRLNSFASEQGRLLGLAIQTFSALQTGKLGLTGATGTAHLHTLLELRALVERSIAQIRLTSATITIPPVEAK